MEGELAIHCTKWRPVASDWLVASNAASKPKSFTVLRDIVRRLEKEDITRLKLDLIEVYMREYYNWGKVGHMRDKCPMAKN
ncbi:hypothetical protein J6590_032317 [Homalodisca vitripennis]|nr:hypothetical protein J6590_032317 [Homalodisca vitripennis]